MTTTAQQRQYPARIGIIVAANVHAEPHGVIKSRMVARAARFAAAFGPLALFRAFTAFTPLTWALTPAAIKHVFRGRELGPMNADKRSRNIFRAAFGEQPRAKYPIFFLKLNWR